MNTEELLKLANEAAEMGLKLKGTREDEIAQLKRQLAERDKTIETLRAARKFYRDQYLKASAAYKALADKTKA